MLNAVRTYLLVLGILAAMSGLVGVVGLIWFFGFRLLVGRYPGRHTGEHGWSVCPNCGTAFTEGPFCPECGESG